MRKLLIGLLAVGMVFAFVGPSFATDMSVSGHYRVRGWYMDGRSAVKTGDRTTNQYYDNRFRIEPKFAIEEGVGAAFRAEVVDGTWGQAAGDNFDCEQYYAWFTTGIGKFQLGRFTDMTWGTAFLDDSPDYDQIMYTSAFGPLTVMAKTVKVAETDRNSTSADADLDTYKLAGIYKWEGGQAGLIGTYVRDAASSVNYKGKYWAFDPYVKANFGPVYFEAELAKYFGDAEESEVAGVQDVDKSGISYYAQAKVNLGPANVGLMYAYVSGDKSAADNDDELGPTGDDWNPSLILFNDGGSGRFGGANFGEIDGVPTGAKVYQIFAGFSPVKKLTTKVALSQFYVDEKRDAAGATLDDDIGTVLDIEATYKLFSSVSYYIGFGYLWAGDYWKGNSAATEIEDAYIIKNQIQWNF